MTDLNLRARKILSAVVHEYLQTGDAVGSRTVTRRHGIDLSPATVRNVMADLEELGLLRQPHTSAGRVPTTQGLRFFIDSLLKVRSLSGKEREEIRARYQLGDDADLEDVLQRVSRVLAELAHQATIVITPVPERQRLSRLEFVRLLGGEVLVVLVTDGGQVQNRLLRAGVPADPAFLARASHYLNDLCAGLSLEDVRHKVLVEMGKEKNQVDQMTSQALRLGHAALAAETSPAIIVSGQAHLLVESEPHGLERMRALLAALEEKERIVQLLDRTLAADGIRVWLGAETPFAEVADLSVVAVPYGPGDRPVGSIAVIGPTRMNYSRVIPLVDFTADVLSDALGQRGGGERREP